MSDKAVKVAMLVTCSNCQGEDFYVHEILDQAECAVCHQFIDLDRLELIHW